MSRISRPVGSNLPRCDSIYCTQGNKLQFCIIVHLHIPAKSRAEWQEFSYVECRWVFVDDSMFVRKWMRIALGTRHYELIEIDSPIGIIEAIARQQPRLVLMDVYMPAIQGNRVTELVRRSGTKRYPLVLYSTIPEARLSALARACGADGYIMKTQDAAAFRRSIQRYLGAPMDAHADLPGAASDRG